MSEFNKIRDTYHRNLFAAPNDVVDVLALYRALPDLGINGDTEEDLYHLAARFADADAIQFLTEAGIKPRADKYGGTALHALAKSKFDINGADRDIKAVKIYNAAAALLKAGVNPKKKGDAGKLAYFEAGLVYMYPLIEALGDASIKMDATAQEGKNLLHDICDKLTHRKTIPGAVEAATKTVRVLIDKSGIDLEDKDIFGSTPLTYAQRSGVNEIAALLSGDEADVITGGMTLHQAILNRDVAAVDQLITRGADLNELSDQYNRTPLMLACEYPSAPMVQLLTAGGADVNYRTGNGETAMFYLLTKGISNFGRGMSQDLKDILRIQQNLIKTGLDVDAAVNNEGDTALNIICQAGYLADLNTGLAEELIDAGCDVNKPNLYGKTPLMSFAQRGNEAKYGIAELLLDNNADTTYIDKNGNTALMYAAANGDHMSAKKIVSLILDADTASVERVNNGGQTAIDIAVQNNNEAVVKQILS